MADPTGEEIEVLKEFRVKVKDLGIDNWSDLEMLRWLRARDLNLVDSEDMLRKHMQFRSEEDLDSILKWQPPSGYAEEYGYEICGRDSKGHPICIVAFGAWDVRKAINSPERRHAWLRYIDRMFANTYERMKETSVEFGREVTQCVLIVDFADFSMRQLTSFANVGTLLEAVRRFEANYPEILYQFYFINAFRVFQMFFALMKPLLSARTIAKLEIYTTPDKWLPIILSRLPKDQLPIEFGGSLTGRRVSSGNALKRASINVDASEMVTGEIAAGDMLKLEFGITESESTIKWRFKTMAHDIGFKVLFGTEEVVPMKRYEVNSREEQGSILCNNTGEYFLIFDNTYSKLRGKTIQYNIEILEPSSTL